MIRIQRSEVLGSNSSEIKATTPFPPCLLWRSVCNPIRTSLRVSTALRPWRLLLSMCAQEDCSLKAQPPVLGRKDIRLKTFARFAENKSHCILSDGSFRVNVVGRLYTPPRFQ